MKEILALLHEVAYKSGMTLYLIEENGYYTINWYFDNSNYRTMTYLIAKQETIDYLKNCKKRAEGIYE